MSVLFRFLLLCYSVFLLSFSAAAEQSETQSTGDNVIELQVSPQMRDRVQEAFKRGKIYDENDVTVIELDDKSSEGILSPEDDAIVIAPPEDRSSRVTLGDTLKSAISPRGDEAKIVADIARAGANVMCKAFLAVFPLAVRMGYGLDLMTEGIARSILGQKQRTPEEREALWQEYARWEMKIQKSGRSLQYMVFEYDEYVDDGKKVPAPPAGAVTVREDVPQKVVVINNVIQTRYIAGKRTVVLGHRTGIRPRGRRIRHRVHYLPGIRRSERKNSLPPRPVVIRKRRHHAAAPVVKSVSGQVKRSVSHRRSRVVMHTKGYRPVKKQAPFRRGKRK